MLSLMSIHTHSSGAVNRLRKSGVWLFRPKSAPMLIFGLWLVSMSLFSGCETVKTSYENYRLTTSGPYMNALHRWTGKTAVYRGFETILLVTGTYKSKDLRQAYVHRYAQANHLDAQSKSVMLTEEIARGESEYEFIVSVYSPEKQKVELSSPRSLWRVYLDLGSGDSQVPPIEIRNLGKERNRIEAYYPYISPWAEVYSIRFKAADPPESRTQLSLVLTGVKGKAELVFKFDQ